MADNVVLNSGSGGDTVAADDISGVKYPRSKVGYGADGSYTDASDSNPFPIKLHTSSIDVMLGTVFASVLGTSSVSGAGTEAGAVRVTLATDSTGLLSVDDNGGSLTVDWDGTAPPIGGGTESTALRVTVASDSTGVLTVDDGGGSLTVDASSLPLPTGAATSANQSTGNTNTGNIDTNTTDLPNVIGTDGSAGPSKALSVGGTESGGTLQEVRVDSDGHLQVDVLSGGGGGTQYSVDTAAGATDTGTLSLVVRDDALATLTPADGDYTQLRTNNRGAMWIVPDGTVSVDWDGTAPPIGAGTEAAALRVTVATDSTGTLSVDDNGGSLTVDNADITTIAGAVSGSEMQVDVVTIPALASGTNTIGNVVNVPSTSGGLTMHKAISAASTNATSVKGSAGQVYDLQAFNVNSAARSLKLYDKASAPTVGTDTPAKVIMIPGNTAGAGVVKEWVQGLEFSSGIAYAVTTGIADSDTGAVAADEIAINLDYE